MFDFPSKQTDLRQHAPLGSSFLDPSKQPGCVLSDADLMRDLRISDVATVVAERRRVAA